MVHISEQIQAQNQTILILELSRSILIDLEAKSRKENGNRIYEIDISVIRELYDALMGKTKNLNIVLFIQRGPCNDKFISDHLTTKKIQDNFTIVRTRDELNFMMGGLFVNSNKIVYASEYKHSLSEGLYILMNPDPKSKNRTLKHINLKEFMKLKDRSDYLKLFQRIIPDAIDLIKETHISGPIGYTNSKSNDKGDRTESGRTKSTADIYDDKKNEDDSSSDNDDGNANNKTNLDQTDGCLDTIFEIDENDYKSDEEQKKVNDTANQLDIQRSEVTEVIKEISSCNSRSKKSSEKDKKGKKSKKDKSKKDDKEKKKSSKQKEKDNNELQKEKKHDEEEKIEMPHKQATKTTPDSSQIKKSLLSTKSTRVFVPTVQTSKDKGFKVDEKGLLKITGFDDSLNLEFTNQLPELFKKISTRFKTSAKMDTTTYIKTFHNMYLQHYNKCFKQTGKFNDDTSAIIFPQIVKFMWDRKSIQGKLLTLIIKEDVFDIKEVEETAKLSIDCNCLLKIFNEYSQKSETEGATGENKKIDLSLEDKIEIILGITQKLLADLIKPNASLPKNKSAMLKKISSSIPKYVNESNIDSEYTQNREKNDQIKFLVLELLQEKNNIILDEKDKKFFEINKDQMDEYLDCITNDKETCKEELSKMEFLNK